MPQIILNGQSASTFTRTARMCCIEAGVDYELRPFADNIEEVFAALKGPDNLAKHPFGRMPSLEDGDRVIFETTAIGRYVSGKYGNDCLVPDEPEEAAVMEQWVSAALCYIIPNTLSKFVMRFVLDNPPDMKQIEADKPILRGHYEILNSALEGKTWFAGDKVTIADLLLAPPLHYVGNMPGGMELFTGLDNLGRWWYTISERESFTETVPDTIKSRGEAA